MPSGYGKETYDLEATSSNPPSRGQFFTLGIFCKSTAIAQWIRLCLLLLPWVQIPSTPSIHFYLYSNLSVKRTKIKEKDDTKVALSTPAPQNLEKAR